MKKIFKKLLQNNVEFYAEVHKRTGKKDLIRLPTLIRSFFVLFSA